MRKSRVTSKNYVTIPRLELVAAVLSLKIAALIRRELDIEWKNETKATRTVGVGQKKGGGK